MRRVTVRGYEQNPTKRYRIEVLGFALENWLAKKRSRIVMEGLAEFKKTVCKRQCTSSCPRVLRKGEEDTFESIFDKLASFASVKHSLRLDDKPVRTVIRRKKNLQAMVIDALRESGTSKCGKGKGVTCWVGNKTGQTSRDRFFNKGKSKGKLGNVSKDAKGVASTVAPITSPRVNRHQK